MTAPCEQSPGGRPVEIGMAARKVTPSAVVAGTTCDVPLPPTMNRSTSASSVSENESVDGSIATDGADDFAGSGRTIARTSNECRPVTGVGSTSPVSTAVSAAPPSPAMDRDDAAAPAPQPAIIAGSVTTQARPESVRRVGTDGTLSKGNAERPERL